MFKHNRDNKSKWIGLLVDPLCQDYESTGIRGDERCYDLPWHFDANFINVSRTMQELFYENIDVVAE